MTGPGNHQGARLGRREVEPGHGDVLAPENVIGGVEVLFRTTAAAVVAELSPGAATKVTGASAVPTDLMATGAYRVLFRAPYTVSPGAAGSAAG